MVEGYFVTDRLAQALKNSDLTGFTLRPVKVVDGEQFWKLRKHRPAQTVPMLWLLDVTGLPGQDGFAVHIHLIVSERALMMLKSFPFAYFILHGEYFPARR